MSPAVRRPLVLVAALVAVASCSGGDDEGSGSSTTPDVALPTSSPTSEPVASSSTAPTPTDATTTTESTAPTTVAPPDRGECLVGDWIVTQEQMNGFYDGLMSTVDAPIGIDATGQAGLFFRADGTYGWAPDFDLVVDVSGQGGVGRTGGSIAGTWSASSGMVTTANDVNAIELSITVNGITFEGSDLANGILTSSPVSGVRYSCAGPTPVIDFKTADPSVTVPVVLTAA